MIQVDDFIIAVKGEGKRIEHGTTNRTISHFEENSVGLVKEVRGDAVIVLLVGRNETFKIPRSEVQTINLDETGDQFERKICNRCHVLKPVEEFAFNQTQKGGRRIRRPSCQVCRLDIERRHIPARIKKEAERKKPQERTVWRCPICEKQTIIGVTSKLALDHDHRSGRTRGYICDSCNTGLGRFRNGKTYIQNALQWLKEDNVLVAWTDEEKKRFRKSKK